MSVLRRGLFLFFFALSLFDASVAFAVPGICRDTLARVSPSIENLFDTAVLINDVSASLRERPVNDLRVVRISDIFPGENEVILGFGKPNVYLMVPRAHQQGSAPPSEKDRYIKFAGKSLKRDVSKIEDTRGFIQSGVLLRFRDLPPESVGKLREAMEKHHGKKYWTCVNVNCRILESAGFSGGGRKAP